VKRLAILYSVLSGCAWSTFDDLADKTPAQAVEKPDGIKATDYGVQIVGVTVDGTGGRLAVLSSGSGNYSTLDFDGHGQDALGDNESLGVHTIDSLTGNAILLSDGAGKVSIVDNSNVGTVVNVTGPATGLVVDQQIPTSQHPDAATYAAGSKLIVVATAAAGMSNGFSATASGVISCTLLDGAAPLSAAAVAANATTLFAWTKAGALLAYPLTAFDTPAACTNVAGVPAGPMVTPAPANGASFALTGSFAVLTSYDTAQTMTGSVAVVDLASATMVGTPIAAHGVHSATLATTGSQTALVLGYPNRTVGSATNVGEVDIHSVDASGNVSATPVETIFVPQADSNLTFGRSVTTMKHNGTTVLVIAASNAVYAYYKTSLYPDSRTP
jgi:hypothetical protein